MKRSIQNIHFESKMYAQFFGNDRVQNIHFESNFLTRFVRHYFYFKYSCVQATLNYFYFYLLYSIYIAKLLN